MYTEATSQPISLTKSTESATYGLFAVAMAISVAGVWFGMHFLPVLYSTGVYIVLLIAQLALVFTAGWWIEKSPLNYILFFGFPLLSGLAITPFISSVIIGYENGPSILLNALSATVFMSAAAAVFAKTTSWDLGFLGRSLFLGFLGLLGFSLLQWFVPALRSDFFEMILSGFGVVLFAVYTAYDIQRIGRLGQMGANPLMLALSLYLDIFNLFLYIVRLMLVLYGDR